MIGPEGAASLLAVRLADTLPAKTAELRARLTVTDPFDLPDVRTVWYGQADTTALEEWPLVEVVTARTAPAIDQGDGVIAIGYGQQVFVWARGVSHEQTTRVRDRLALAVMEILAQDPGLAAGVVVRSGWAWSMSGIVRDAQARTLGGARLDLVVDVEESVDPADGITVPRVEVIHLDTTAVPPAAAT